MLNCIGRVRTEPSLQDLHDSLVQERKQLLQTVTSHAQMGLLSVSVPWGGILLPMGDVNALISSASPITPSAASIHLIAQWMLDWRMTGDHRPQLKRYMIDPVQSHSEITLLIERKMELVSRLERLFHEREQAYVFFKNDPCTSSDG
jgi:hypothetical protein